VDSDTDRQTDRQTNRLKSKQDFTQHTHRHTYLPSSISLSMDSGLVGNTALNTVSLNSCPIILAYLATICCSELSFSKRHTTKYWSEFVIFAFILIASMNSSSPFSDIKLAIVLHQKAFPDDISFTNWASFCVTLPDPERKKEKGRDRKHERREGK
jgi:hypothetical protein